MDFLAAVAMVAILVFIHEFGHFIVAKACGVHVPVFSLGFGRRLFGIRVGGTDYRVSLLPFGGYVKMAGANFGYMDEDDEDLPDDPERGFMRRPVWQRLLVVAAGPAFNLALPLVVFTVLLMAGEPQPAPVVGGVDRDSPAAEAGLAPGDRVVAVDGREVSTWDELLTVLHEREGARHDLTVERGAGTVSLSLYLPEETSVGISHSRPSTVVGVDDPASPAGAAGLATGDRIVAVQGQPVSDWVELQQVVAAVPTTPGSELRIDVETADGEQRSLVLVSDPSWRPVDDPPLGPEQA
ncbi:MAG: RIP metalloprotease RseP, partial [Deltaproteobacteria bacterium]